MLKEDENILFGKIIGYISGLDGDADPPEEELIRACMKAIQKQEDLKPYIDKMITAKETYLPGCISCGSPCGRSDDFYLNDHPENEKMHELYHRLLMEYTDEMSFHDLRKRIFVISWC